MDLPPVSPTPVTQPVRKVDPSDRQAEQRRRESRREQAGDPPPAEPGHVDTHV